jgi:hypothetical protein
LNYRNQLARAKLFWTLNGISDLTQRMFASVRTKKSEYAFKIVTLHHIDLPNISALHHGAQGDRWVVLCDILDQANA